jgi:nucleoside phosphorylase
LKKKRGGLGDRIISCGLAGGLRHDLPTGTILIPHDVLSPDGTTLHCDDELVERLIAGARTIGIEPRSEPMVTTTTVVTGGERRRWADRGYAAVDMETGLLRAPRVAAVRTILDTPLRELSEDWLNPALAALKPWNWRELLWLAREGPRCARLAAQVVAAALS